MTSLSFCIFIDAYFHDIPGCNESTYLRQVGVQLLLVYIFRSRPTSSLLSLPAFHPLKQKSDFFYPKWLFPFTSSCFLSITVYTSLLDVALRVVRLKNDCFTPLVEKTLQVHNQVYNKNCKSVHALTSYSNLNL